MGPTILFTYLKIILPQCFSVFSFSFQFSAVSKRIKLKDLKLEPELLTGIAVQVVVYVLMKMVIEVEILLSQERHNGPSPVREI